ncbi:hypothetical protein BOTBODRAFT_137162 [Botryobasidium botryosum FD-172 SS1]|uniref:Matrin-type domain-containing protein n=1 Tax=Botryobasidium botryosum (strain FD-172 SS1) TaxID=930990 RepID=A0A067M5S6_BOTB1|nr:hypothetical protein BOTBODRAFT_137162 [Botryobasidium botryosum FD-172 SS1]
MSEYWVSKKKYFCKYCDIFIADDAPSRQQHENGLRHQGNKNKFIRDLYKSGERKKRDLDEEKREMKRVEAAAEAAYAKDVGAALASSSSTASTSASTSASAPVSAPAPKVHAKPSNPYANYSTAESLGYTDVDADFAIAEAERRKQEGFVGGWTTVEAPQPAPPDPAPHDGQAGTNTDTGVPRASTNIAITSENDNDNPRDYRLGKRRVGVGLGEIWDPGEIRVKVKREDSTAKIEEPESSKFSGPPTWTARGWNKAGEGDKGKEQAGATVKIEGEDGGGVVKREDEGPSISTSTLVQEDTKPHIKEEESSPTLPLTAPAEDSATNGDAQPPPSASTGSMFRKRKAPAATANRGARRKI